MIFHAEHAEKKHAEFAESLILVGRFAITAVLSGLCVGTK
jgi:hypothetical protein